MERILLKDIKIQYYPAQIRTTKPLGETSLEYILNAIKEPDPNIKEVFRQIAGAELSGNMELKAKLKQDNLYYFTMCCSMDPKGVEREGKRGKYRSYRCYDNISHFNGLAVLDFDHIESAEEFRDYIFDNRPYIISAFLSPSKKGVKFIVKIPVVNTIEEFKEYFFGLGMVFDLYEGWDGSGQNCVLPLFISIDPGIRTRTDAETFTKKGQKKEFYSTPKNTNVVIEVGKGDQKKVLENFKKAINAINTNGHPQLRAACISLGGYVAGGYLTEFEAVDFADSMIVSNGYLQKGISGYKKTARQAINKGQEKALSL